MILRWFTVKVENAFSGLFFRKQKGTRVFRWQEDVNAVVISAFFIYKTESQFFEILIFSRNIWGNVHYVREINLISQGTLIKTFYIPIKTNQKKSETRFYRRKTAEDDNATINVSANIPCTFLLFKGSAFLQIKLKFWKRKFFITIK